MSVGDINTRARRPSTPGSNTQIIFNNGGVDGAQANATYNIASNTLSVEGNIMCSNATAIYFGGAQGNTANALWYVYSNVSSNSIDFWWQ
jgi:hypothetical protein